MGRLANIALRGVTLVSKFLLVFILAKFLDPAHVGLFGLAVVTVGYALHMVGFDFYTYSTRELLKKERSEWGGMLKSQGAFFILTYFLFMPLLFSLFLFDFLPLYLLSWFFLLLVLEHVGQELYRLLIAVSRPILASWVLFLRSGVWVLWVVIVMFLWPDLRTLEVVFLSWAVGAAAAIALGIYTLRRMRVSGWSQKVDWRWIWRGVKIAFPLLLATLAIRGVYTLDRYWFESLVDVEVLAAYVIFISISNALISFLDAGVFSFMYPALIRQWQKRSAKEFRWQLKQMLIHTSLLCVMFFVSGLALLPLLLEWIGHSIYREYSYLFPWLMGSSVIMAVSMVPHYALYAQGKDKHIVLSHLVAFMVFVLSALAFSRVDEVVAIPAAMVLGFSVMLAWKVVAYCCLTPSDYQAVRRSALDN